MNADNGMPFGRKIKIELKPVTPSRVTAKDLKKSLNSIGLNCAHTDEKRLESYINEVISGFDSGKYQGIGIYKYIDTPNVNENLNHSKSLTAREVVEKTFLKLNINSEWELTPGAEYQTKLEKILSKDNFDYLKKNYSGFCGNKRIETIEKENTTPQAIKETFLLIARSLTTSVFEGLTKETIEAFLVGIIPNIEEGAKDYDAIGERIVLLVKGYNPAKRECDAVGGISCYYKISIKNYKEKKDSHQDSSIHIEMRSFISSDLGYIDALVDFLDKNIGNDIRVVF